MVEVIYPRSEAEIKKEVAAIKKAGKEIRSTPETARAFLIKHGFLTKGNKLSKQYR